MDTILLMLEDFFPVVKTSHFFCSVSSFYCIFFCFSQIRQLDVRATREITGLPKFLNHRACPTKVLGLTTLSNISQAESQSERQSPAPGSYRFYLTSLLPKISLFCVTKFCLSLFWTECSSSAPKGWNAVTENVVTVTKGILRVILCTQLLSNIMAPQRENGSHHVMYTRLTQPHVARFIHQQREDRLLHNPAMKGAVIWDDLLVSGLGVPPWKKPQW